MNVTKASNLTTLENVLPKCRGESPLPIYFPWIYLSIYLSILIAFSLYAANKLLDSHILTVKINKTKFNETEINTNDSTTNNTNNKPRNDSVNTIPTLTVNTTSQLETIEQIDKTIIILGASSTENNKIIKNQNTNQNNNKIENKINENDEKTDLDYVCSILSVLFVLYFNL